MNLTETGMLLGYIQLGDHRTVDKTLIRYWHEDLVGDLDYDDAREAVRRHRLDSTEYLQAAHVRAGVRKLQDERRRATPGRALGGPAAFQRSAEQQADVARRAEQLRQGYREARATAGRPLQAVSDPADFVSERVRLTEPEPEEAS